MLSIIIYFNLYYTVYYNHYFIYHLQNEVKLCSASHGPSLPSTPPISPTGSGDDDCAMASTSSSGLTENVAETTSSGTTTDVEMKGEMMIGNLWV